MTQHPAVAAVGELVRTQTMRIQVTPDIAYTARAPCLLQQLVDAIGANTSGHGGSTIARSTTPIDADAWDLWVEITHNAHAWAQLLNVDAHRYIAPEPTGARPAHIATPPAGKLLRAVAVVAATTRPVVADAIAHHTQRWTRQITAMLTGRHEQRALYGAGCPQCTAIQPYPRNLIGPRSGPQPTTSIVELREENGREIPYRVPAIVLVVQEYAGEQLRWLACRACGWNTPLTGDNTEVVYSSTDTPNDLVELDNDPPRAA